MLVPACRQHHLSLKFMMSEGASWDDAWLEVAPILADAQAPFVGILASHSYGDYDLVDEGRSLFRAASQQYKIPVWMSEMSIIGPPDDPSMDTALRIAHVMYRDIVQGRARPGSSCTVIFDPDFPGSLGILSPVTATGKLVVPKRFWAMANYTHFVRPGWKRIRIDGLSFANGVFIGPEGDRFAIVALNASVNVHPATYHFGDWTLSSVEAYATSEQSNLAPAIVQLREPGKPRK